MSARVSQIIEVIDQVRCSYQSDSGAHSIHEIRVRAAKSVADRRGIAFRSVEDKFIRQLAPDIKSASQFDALLESWLVVGSNQLRDIVSKHVVDSDDEHLIASTFANAPEHDISLPEEIHDPEKYLEGSVKAIAVNAYERNLKARAACIKHFGLACVVCGFDFKAVYGGIGTGFIHVHHIVPLAEIGKQYELDPIKDLRPVCPNCHAIIHRTQPARTVEQLKTQLRGTQHA
jgi:predicted HNH restriction endonuclease